MRIDTRGRTGIEGGGSRMGGGLVLRGGVLVEGDMSTYIIGNGLNAYIQQIRSIYSNIQKC